MKPNKDGKKPISQKPQIDMTPDEFFGNTLAVPADVKGILAEKGLEARWLNAVKLSRNSGLTQYGWNVYKRSEEDRAKMGSLDFNLGTAPDGTIRRGDLVLAVRPLNYGEYHRHTLRQKALRAKASFDGEAAEALRMVSKGQSKVISGYDSEGDDDDND